MWRFPTAIQDAATAADVSARAAGSVSGAARVAASHSPASHRHCNRCYNGCRSPRSYLKKYVRHTHRKQTTSIQTRREKGARRRVPQGSIVDMPVGVLCGNDGPAMMSTGRLGRSCSCGAHQEGPQHTVHQHTSTPAAKWHAQSRQMLASDRALGNRLPIEHSQVWLPALNLLLHWTIAVLESRNACCTRRTLSSSLLYTRSALQYWLGSVQRRRETSSSPFVAHAPAQWQAVHVWRAGQPRPSLPNE